MKLINLTPHTVHIYRPDRRVRAIRPSGQCARVEERTEPAGQAGGIPLVRTLYGASQDLPAPERGVMYIVSNMVRMAEESRVDLCSPGELVRDEEGRIVGCRALIVNPGWIQSNENG